MNPTQKRIVVVLAIVAVIVLIAFALLITRSLEAVAPSSPVSVPGTPTPDESFDHLDGTRAAAATVSAMCEWKAAQQMVEAGIGGTVSFTPGGILRFDSVHSLTPDQSVDEAAQAVWVAFDVALALAQDGCDAFAQVEVLILVRDDQGDDTRIRASVGASDLHALGAGDLDEDAFIHRVTYQVSDG